MLLASSNRTSLVRNGIVVVLFLATFCPELQAQKQPILFEQTHRAMGTEFKIDLYAADEQTAAQIADEAFDEVDRLEALLSNYRPSSELSRIGREGGAGPVTPILRHFSFSIAPSSGAGGRTEPSTSP